MLSRAHTERTQRIADALAAADRLIAADPTLADGRAFLERYYARLAPEDVLPHSAERLAQDGLSLWRFGSARKPGSPKIRVLLTRPDGGKESIVEIVNDDMPFLVDSIAGALSLDGHEVHSLIHPIVAVNRDAQGLRIGVGEGLDSPGMLAESYMHIAVSRLASEADANALADRLLAVLGDVRAAVQDWRLMLVQVEDAISQLGDNPPPLPAEEVAEARDLLAWMRDNHFTFLGYRDYVYGRAGEAEALRIAPESGLGILRDTNRRLMRQAGTDLSAADIAPEAREFLHKPQLLLVLKANVRSTVHRPVHLDMIALKMFDREGRVVGERRFVGLFTSTAYSAMPAAIPYLRRKLRRVVERAGLSPVSHDGKSLQSILDSYPRDELWQIEEDDLFRIANGILALQERPRTKLFLRRDKFQRFVSALVFTPRERLTTDLRLAFGDLLARAFAGRVAANYTQVGNDPLARLHFIIVTQPGQVPDVDIDALEADLVLAARDWRDGLREALEQYFGAVHARTLFARYGDGFPAGYRENHGGEAAAQEVAQFERLGGDDEIAVAMHAEGEDDLVQLRLYRLHHPAPLSDILPRLEHLGFRVIEERPYRIQRRNANQDHDFVWMQEFRLETALAKPVVAAAREDALEAAIRAVWRGAAESDGFNRLIIGAGLDWRQAMMLRAAARYLRQAGVAFSFEYMDDCFARHPALADAFVRLFETKFDPDRENDRFERLAAINDEIAKGLNAVQSQDDDRIMRLFWDFFRAMLRTNYFQAGADGLPKPYLSLKIDSHALESLPDPRPYAEIFVYSPRMEGVHLRGGKVARGGIRWSDRREDFRSEILGLLKAQMVKNAVIVPVGAKGGFVQKRMPDPADREAWLADGIECYKTLIRGMLDITDNRLGGAVIAPQRVVRHDGDDPYLVVAADKGTATFSDIANGLAIEYGFWLGDAFASGGSVGYDHKKMGITARGAWELVKRHFREMGRDIQTEDFTVAGVGDMSGDVFGNGMLLSSHIRLVAAFDHRHIFIDPNPDAARSHIERQRLFNLPRSSWMDYDASLISAGGGIFDRKSKLIPLSSEMKALLGLAKDQATPQEIMQAILKAPVDLLWFGGIGTYVRAQTETDIQVHDRANDPIRVNGHDLRAKVIGEGANLGVTQAGRIEFALAGGRINTDAVDNSAGVDCSDHEVNIKILLADLLASNQLSREERDNLLSDMTDEVAMLVLADNYAQGATLSLEERGGAVGFSAQVRFMRVLERMGRLDRALEGLPDEATLVEREAKGIGLTRPELAVLMAYAKSWAFDEIFDKGGLDSAGVDHFADDLEGYFPNLDGYGFKNLDGWQRIARRHGLAREIIATVLANRFVNICGITAFHDLLEQNGASPRRLIQAFDLAWTMNGAALWPWIEAMNGEISAGLQYAALLRVRAAITGSIGWLLRMPRWVNDRASANALVRAYDSAAQNRLMVPDLASAIERAAQTWQGQGMTIELAQGLALMEFAPSLLDCAALAVETEISPQTVAHLYYGIGARMGFAWLRTEGATIATSTPWDRLARDTLLDDLAQQQRELTRSLILSDRPDLSSLPAADEIFSEDFRAGTLDLARLTIAAGMLRRGAQKERPAV